MNPNIPEFPTCPADEASIIGSILIGGAATLKEVSDAGISELSFDEPHLALAFRSAIETAGAGRPVTATEVLTRVMKSGSPANIGLIERTQETIGTPLNVGHHIPAVLEASQRRSVMRSAIEALTSAANLQMPLERARAALQSIQIKPPSDGAVLSGESLVASFEADIERRRLLNGALPGIATGLRDFDRLTGGLQRGELVVIGARPSAGKSALALTFVRRALSDNIPVLFVSLEMSPDSLTRRMASASCRIPLRDLREINREHFDREHLAKLASFNLRLAAAPYTCVNGQRGMTANQIEEIVARQVESTGCQLVVIDYLQKIIPDTKGEKRTYEVGAISGRMKAIAAQYNVAVLSLAQLNRESEQADGRVPRLSDLADSSQIERDADLVGLLHRKRDERDPNGTRAKLIIAKQRDGDIGIVELEFEGEFVEFRTPSLQVYKAA